MENYVLNQHDTTYLNSLVDTRMMQMGFGSNHSSAPEGASTSPFGG
jgi:hypothetical protein